MRARSLRFLALSLALGGCASLPQWFPFSRRPYYPYLDNPRFSFEYPLQWGDGLRIHGGVEFREPHGRASFSIAFWPEEDPSYKQPDAFRREMSDWGAVEDSHLVSEVVVSSRTAYRVRITTYKYSPEYMLGARVPRILYSEKTLVPDPAGVYMIDYTADKKYFWKKSYRSRYDHFLKSLILAQSRGKK